VSLAPVIALVVGKEVLHTCGPEVNWLNKEVHTRTEVATNIHGLVLPTASSKRPGTTAHICAFVVRKEVVDTTLT
jgi:hypothetical protein